MAARRHVVSEEDKKMYALEKLENFRWISKILATRSPVVLTEENRASPTVELQLAEIGEFWQFAELVFSIIPLDLLLQHVAPLSEPGFPLEGCHALNDAQTVSSIRGHVGNLPAIIVYRSSVKQLIVAISGTSSVGVALYDLRAWKCNHPSNRGQVHSGFWALYTGLKDLLFSALKKGFTEHEVDELVITGHSMGSSLSYLLCMDLLAGSIPHALDLPADLKITLAVFGPPRTGDSALVEFWRELVANWRNTRGDDKFVEYSVKAYNDGVPSLPPMQLGYRHFAAEPLYLDRTQLYHTPPSESEHALFKITNEDDTEYSRFSKGGHNYYNNRDFELMRRRLEWLEKADVTSTGWEERYRQIASI
ncbi:hypothetical protein H0H93_001226 [Arthromyces matolae]|nr:hypothetical protein H0H93_001226 [Arthromyces matolae]